MNECDKILSVFLIIPYFLLYYKCAVRDLTLPIGQPHMPHLFPAPGNCDIFFYIYTIPLYYNIFF